MALGRYVTPDEPAWVYRAVRFADAIASRDWSAIPVTGHPGVTTMALGAIGVTVQRALAPAESALHLDWVRRLAWFSPQNGEAVRHLSFFLSAGRLAVALTTTLGLALLYGLLARAFDRRLALTTATLLACDPFLIGHSGLLHTDALLTTFTALALACGLGGLREPERSLWWAGAGLFAGLALATKTPALILLPFLPCLAAVSQARAWLRSRSTFLSSSRPLHRHALSLTVHTSLFIAVTAATLVALYPALWADPMATLHTLSAFAGRHVEMVQRPIFFIGKMTYDPGPGFYPLVFLLRISPPVWIGLAGALIGWRHIPPDRRLAILLLIAFAFTFGALMGLGAKKHDRYLLPVVPPITLASVVGLEAGLATISPQRFCRRPAILPALALGTQALLLLPFAAYPLKGFNLLTGGPWGAASILTTDWGEALGAAARQLSRDPDTARWTVAVTSVPSFASLFQGQTIPLETATLADAIATPDSDTVYPPRPQVTVNAAPIRLAAYLAAHATGDHRIVLDASGPLLHHDTGPAPITSFADSDLPTREAIQARLDAFCGQCTLIWYVADPAASPITAAYLRQILGLPNTSANAWQAGETSLPRPRLIRLPPPHMGTNTAPEPSESSYLATFDHQLILVDALSPAQANNIPFTVWLRWQTSAPTPLPFHASLQLRDADGYRWAEVGQPVLNETTFPTSAWQPGEWADQTFRVRPPVTIPPGEYDLLVTVSDANGAQRGAWDAAGQFQGVQVLVGTIHILPPDTPSGAEAATCPPERQLPTGPIQGCLEEPPPTALSSGDSFGLTVRWLALNRPAGDYRLRWRLIAADGKTAWESEPMSISAYPISRWRAGDVYDSRYTLRSDPFLPAGRYRLTLSLWAGDRPVWSEEASVAEIEFQPRERSFDLPAESEITHPMSLMLGGQVHLMGFNLERTQAVPGGTVPITLYWQANGPTDLDYTVFIHLVGADDHLHGQADYRPGGGPTSSWVTGQVVVDAVTLPVDTDAPTGVYHIAVGMYDAASGGRLPITDSDGNPLPDGQAILPIEIEIQAGGTVP